MDEAAARRWLQQRNVPRETLERLEQLIGQILSESRHQNLVAASTLPSIWARHIVDSAQLLDHVDDRRGLWVDVGTGAGFPGIVIALLRNQPLDCVEPRARRAVFLSQLVKELGISDRVTIIQRRAELVPPKPCAIISARAVASLGELFSRCRHLAISDTIWLCMKGRTAAAELADACAAWQGDFRLVPSITDPAASIVVARDVRPRSGR